MRRAVCLVVLSLVVGACTAKVAAPAPDAPDDVDASAPAQGMPIVFRPVGASTPANVTADAGAPTTDVDASVVVDAGAPSDPVDATIDPPDTSTPPDPPDTSVPVVDAGSPDADDGATWPDTSVPDAADSAPPPPPNPCTTPGRYSRQAAGVVDSTTGLTWTDPPALQMNHGEAVLHCQALGAPWRLPTGAELQCIILSQNACLPAIDQVAFPNTPYANTNSMSDAFWGSDYVGQGGPYPLYAIAFFWGGGGVGAGSTIGFADVRCVR